MTLTNLFNFKYIKEQIKKNKVYMLLLFILFPLLFATVVIGITGENNVIDLNKLSPLMALFIFVPFLISYFLNGFLYKKKSIDFTISLPLTRKEIYLSNSLLGIFTILLFLIINILVLYIGSLIFNVILPLPVIFDFIIFWFITYTFILAVSNLSICLCGNFIASLILCAIFIFVIPFTYDFISIRGNGNYFKLSDNNIEEVNTLNKDSNILKKLEDDSKKGYYRVSVNSVRNNYTNIVYGSSVSQILNNFNEFKLFNVRKLITTVILTIIYFGLSYFAFIKRKMEVSEVSFRTYKTHSLVKMLVMSPLVLLFLNVVLDGYIDFVLFILLIIIIGLFYVIDLITGIGIKNFKHSLIYLILLFVFVLPISLINSYNSNFNNYYELDDIEEVSIEFDDNSFKLNNVKNKDIIKLIYLDNFRNTSIGEYNYYEYLTYKFKLNNKTLVGHQILDDNLKEKLMKEVKEHHLEGHLDLIRYDDVLNVVTNGIGYKKYDLDKLKYYIDIENKEKINNDITRTFSDSFLYQYDNINHEVVKYGINNYDFNNYLLNINNKYVINKLKDIKDINDIKDISINPSTGTYQYIEPSNYKDIYNYIINIKLEEFDSSKDYIKLNMYYEVNNKYQHVTVYLNEYSSLIKYFRGWDNIDEY